MPRKIPFVIQQYIRERANFLCEYCHASEKWQYVAFTVEHIIPISLGGSDDSENLALCCFACNRRKSNKIEGLDPLTQQSVRLFNPRAQEWAEHFVWSKDKLHLIGQTRIGRATIFKLDLNRDRWLNIRKADLEIQRHPPEDDPFL